jgi:peptide/nickel transport system permease protein
MTAAPQSYPRLVWQRFRRSGLALFGLVLLVGLALCAVAGPWLAPHDPDVRFEPYAPPSRLIIADGWLVHVNPAPTGRFDPVTLEPLRSTAGVAPGGPLHLLGTDRFGRDIFSRALIASRLSLGLALVVVLLTTTTGLLVGATAGYRGGVIDRWLCRLIDLVLAFPQLPFYLALGAIIPITLGAGGFLAILVAIMAALGWAGLAREVRARTMGLARMDYVRAAIALGASDRRIVWRHIAPNLASHLLVSITLNLPAVVLLESFLGFLGLAVKPPLISWGLMLQDAASFAAIGSSPWILAPVGFVFATVLACNAVGDGLRDAVDPY